MILNKLLILFAILATAFGEFRDEIPDKTLVKEMVELASAVYKKSGEDARYWLTKKLGLNWKEKHILPDKEKALQAGFEEVCFLYAADGTQVWVLESTNSYYKKTVVAFRGTDETADWATNFDVDFQKPVFGGEGKIHSGFSESLYAKQTINFTCPKQRGKKTDTVGNMLNFLIRNERNHLYVTGHSLG